MAVEVAGDVEREVASYPHAHGSHHRIQDVPVIVEEAFPTGLDETVVGVAARWRPLRRVRDEGTALLQAGQHAGHALGPFQAAVEAFDEVLLAHTLGGRRRRGQDGDAVFLSHPPHPAFVGVGALLQDLRLDTGDADHIVEDGVRLMSGPTPPPLPDELELLLRRMHLPYMRRMAPEVLATARAQRWDPAEVLKLLLGEEIAGRERSALATRRARAAFPTGKTFHTSSLSSIPSPTQTALRTLELIGRHENMVVCGPSGTGKNVLPGRAWSSARRRGRTQSSVVQPRGTGRAGASPPCRRFGHQGRASHPHCAADRG